MPGYYDVTQARSDEHTTVQKPSVEHSDSSSSCFPLMNLPQTRVHVCFGSLVLCLLELCHPPVALVRWPQVAPMRSSQYNPNSLGYFRCTNFQILSAGTCFTNFCKRMLNSVIAQLQVGVDHVLLPTIRGCSGTTPKPRPGPLQPGPCDRIWLFCNPTHRDCLPVAALHYCRGH